jgi:hypothetical protein
VQTITKRLKSEKRHGCPNTYGTPMVRSADDHSTAHAAASVIPLGLIAFGVITHNPFSVMLGAVVPVQWYFQTLNNPPSRWWYAISAGLAVVAAVAIGAIRGAYVATALWCIGAAGGLALSVAFNSAMTGLGG